MKKFRLVVSLIFLVIGFATVAHADLDGFLLRVNEQAKADMSKFSVRLSVQFGVPVPKVDEIIRSVAAPADAFMVLQLGQMTRKPPETVVQTYTKNRGKGWGVIAKELGIKPGSPEFHALKRGDFALTGEPGGSGEKEHGRGKGKGKGHNRE
jgi:hypothetical protein